MLEKTIFGLSAGFALGCDAFAVGVAIGTRDPNKAGRFRLWFHFGLFQFIMPILGWGIGSSIYELIKGYTNWAASGLMLLIASNMLYESLKADCDENSYCRKDPTKGISLIMLSIATSMDALGVGFGMGVTRMEPLYISVLIGILAAIMTSLGLKLGRKISCSLGKRVETLGAIILYIIAWRLFYL
jgi:putative Mn2+ efflux pump MntP